MPTALSSHHDARSTLLGPSFRCPLFDFTGAAVPSSDSSRAETVTGASEGGDGRKTSVSAVQEYSEKHTDF